MAREPDRKGRNWGHGDIPGTENSVSKSRQLEMLCFLLTKE